MTKWLTCMNVPYYLRKKWRDRNNLHIFQQLLFLNWNSIRKDNLLKVCLVQLG